MSILAAYSATERGILAIKRARAIEEDRIRQEAEETPSPKWVSVNFSSQPVRRIETIACRVFGVSRAEVRSRSRKKDLVFARQFIAYWACRRTNHSLPTLGRLMGNFDHTTVLHNHKKYVEKRAAMGRMLRPAR